ncbi:MAG TPA: Imm70 family immunity protein [Opitutaceae bacterium]|nr:Imm70 family immunity protein [Opitutaceae bacterium]
MSLYLCVFDGPRELAGADLGSYADFGAFRRAVAERFEAGEPGARFPTLMRHSDCEGEWTPAECALLAAELAALAGEAGAGAPFGPFTDVDGEDLIGRLRELAEAARRHDLPILFQ